MTTRAVAALLLAGTLACAAAPVLSQPQDQYLGVYANNMPFGSTDLEFATDGTLFVSGGSGGLGKIYRVPPGGGPATLFVSSGLSRPWGLAFDPGGTLYVADMGDGAVANSGRILRVSSTGTLTVFKSGLPLPCSIVFDPAGNLHVGLFSSNKVVKITPAGVMSDYATGLGGSGEQVMQLSFDPSGNLYAGVEQDMYRVGPGGSPVTKVISGGLLQAMGHVRWGNDNFIVATFGFRRLLFASPTGGVHGLTNTTLPSDCTDGFINDNAALATASVNRPTSMRMRDGLVYLADQNCHTVRSFFHVTPTRAPTWGQVKVRYR